MSLQTQGGIAIVQESYCIAGNIIDRQDQNGGNGCGFHPYISYTLTATDIHAICEPTVFVQHQFGNYKEGITTLRAEGGDNSGGSENLVATADTVEQTNLVRRLTPLECERLMGYPDHLKAKGTLWLWELKDISITGIGFLISVFAPVQLGFMPPIVLTAAYAFLTIQFEGTSILDFIRYSYAFLFQNSSSTNGRQAESAPISHP